MNSFVAEAKIQKRCMSIVLNDFFLRIRILTREAHLESSVFFLTPTVTYIMERWSELLAKAYHNDVVEREQGLDPLEGWRSTRKRSLP